MSAAEFNVLRKELAEWINSLNDTQLLNFLNSIKLSTSKRTEGDWWEELTSDEKENIRLGIKDLEEGRVHSSVDFWQQLNG